MVLVKLKISDDKFYIMDGSRWGSSVEQRITDIQTLDTNYATTYYPWVKVIDESKNKPVWVPPSVVLPGVLSFNDSELFEWFWRCNGLNRGGLSSVLE